MRVLVAVDGSPGSFLAVDQIGGLLRSGKDEVAIYCSPPDFRLRDRSVGPEVVLRARQALADAIFEEARKKLPAAMQEGVEKILGTHDPRHGIVTAAEQWPADLVAVGARGLGAFERLLLGSVSRAAVAMLIPDAWFAVYLGSSPVLVEVVERPNTALPRRFLGDVRAFCLAT